MNIMAEAKTKENKEEAKKVQALDDAIKIRKRFCNEIR